jgi:Holliday junction resolvase
VSRGLDRERQVCSLLREQGWWAKRGGMGEVDVVAAKAAWDSSLSLLLFVQVKSTLTPFAHFGPARRLALIADADLAGAAPWLCWWPSRGKPKWLAPKDWPA